MISKVGAKRRWQQQEQGHLWREERTKASQICTFNPLKAPLRCSKGTNNHIHVVKREQTAIISCSCVCSHSLSRGTRVTYM